MTDRELFDSLAYKNENAYLKMTDKEKEEMYAL